MVAFVHSVPAKLKMLIKDWGKHFIQSDLDLQATKVTVKAFDWVKKKIQCTENSVFF